MKEIDILWLICWGLGGECAITSRAIGVPGTVQVIGAELRIWEWPVLFVAPLVESHDKELDWLVLFDPILLPLEPVIVPAQLHPDEIHGVTTGNQAVSTLWENARPIHVRPGTDDQALVCACDCASSTLLHTSVICQGRPQEEVVPAADIERGHGDVFVALIWRDAPPAIVVGGMRQPLQIKRRKSG
jgi:hypothetical protein